MVERQFYQHFAIYHDYDGNVIHYSGEPLQKNNASIKISPFKNFLGKEKVFYTLNINKSFLRKTILARANARLGSHNYNLLNNNCEHFVNWCALGVKECKQINRLLDLTLFKLFPNLILCNISPTFKNKLLTYDIKEKYIYIKPQKQV